MKGPIRKGPDMNPTTRASNKAKERRTIYLSHIAPDDDQQNVMERGGEGIDQEMRLGRNIFDTDDVILAPMRKDETLIRVTAGRHESYNSSVHHAVMELAVRHGANDLADHQPALFADGSRRPAMPIESLPDSKPYFDNMIFSDIYNNKANIIDYAKGFGKTQGNFDKEKPDAPKWKRVNLQPGCKNKKTGRQTWKLAMADVSLADGLFMLAVYLFAKKEWDGEDGTLFTWLLHDERQQHKKRLEVTIEDLVKSVRIAYDPEFRIEDVDITIDFPGTLHASDYVQKLKCAGYTIINHMCGKQCVKCIPPGHNGVIIKVYNKITETMQQGKARDDAIKCKVAKLLSPSTDGLNKNTLTEKYHNNGITRLEITLPFNKQIEIEGEITQLDLTWNHEKMYKLLGDAHRLLTDCLVSSSIHDHLVGMDEMVDRSIAVYFGDTYDYKHLKYMQTKNKKMHADEWHKRWPDAILARTSNSDTGKMNGVEIHAQLKGRGSDDNGWNPFALVAAACSIKGGKHPTMMVCVAGLDKFFGVTDSLRKPLIRHLYFRAVPLICEPVFPRVTLQTFYIGTQNNEWEQINVRPEELKFNPAITPLPLRRDEILTEISIPENFSPDELPDMKSTCSEAVAKLTGLPKGVQYATEYNMPTEPSQWSEVKMGLKQGRAKKGEEKVKKQFLKFKFKGQWHWMPLASELEFRKVYRLKSGKELTPDALPNIKCTFHWGNAGFVCSFDDIVDATEIEGNTSNAPPHAIIPGTMHIGNISKSTDIPVSINGHLIETGGFQQRGKETRCFISLKGLVERFFLPGSIKDHLLALAKSKSIARNINIDQYTLDFLAGCRLIRPDDDMIRITDYVNREPRMWIMDPSEKIVVLPRETSRSEGARESKRQKYEKSSV